MKKIEEEKNSLNNKRKEFEDLKNDLVIMNKKVKVLETV